MTQLHACNIERYSAERRRDRPSPFHELSISWKACSIAIVYFLRFFGFIGSAKNNIWGRMLTRLDLEYRDFTTAGPPCKPNQEVRFPRLPK